uniref:Uncharacterized protein n=1 Tax=viral metagenome TaxID=1070528 RepID=A0A6H1ZHY8_9ZZZZ
MRNSCSGEKVCGLVIDTDKALKFKRLAVDNDSLRKCGEHLEMGANRTFCAVMNQQVTFLKAEEML